LIGAGAVVVALGVHWARPVRVEVAAGGRRAGTASMPVAARAVATPVAVRAEAVVGLEERAPPAPPPGAAPEVAAVDAVPLAEGRGDDALAERAAEHAVPPRRAAGRRPEPVRPAASREVVPTLEPARLSRGAPCERSGECESRVCLAFACQ
jgi:hypothetical protein